MSSIAQIYEEEDSSNLHLHCSSIYTAIAIGTSTAAASTQQQQSAPPLQQHLHSSSNLHLHCSSIYTAIAICTSTAAASTQQQQSALQQSVTHLLTLWT
jgi:serine protease inhibitor